MPDSRILAGEYPGDRDTTRAREKISALLNAGVEAFIDLTEEGELDAYESLLRQVERKSVAAYVALLESKGPRRTAILLLGGTKKGGDRWYEVNVPIADKLYANHLADLREEGLIDDEEVS